MFRDFISVVHMLLDFTYKVLKESSKTQPLDCILMCIAIFVIIAGIISGNLFISALWGIIFLSFLRILFLEYIISQYQNVIKEFIDENKDENVK